MGTSMKTTSGDKTLPASVPNTFQGATSTIDFTFTGTQPTKTVE